VSRVPLDVTLFTDPACPVAFSAEPVRWRLRWHYGDQLRWTTRMIGLTLDSGEAAKLAEGAPTITRSHGMPINPAPYSRPSSSEPACRAFVAARIHAPERADALLRAMRVRRMAGGLIDEPEFLAAAAADAGLDAAQLDAWVATTEVEYQADVDAARAPAPRARNLDHKLGGPRPGRRYSAPTYLFGEHLVPGLNPIEVYETQLANIAPELERRRLPHSARRVLEWAGEPLATAEVALLLELDPFETRNALSKVATPRAVGADFYWTLAD
jgi:predicted DsbA family dithiol-disulfide isomerase